MRLFIHQRRGAVTILDPEGGEYSSVDEAKREATLAARQILGDGLLRGELDLTPTFEIGEEDGRILLQVPFSDTVNVRF